MHFYELFSRNEIYILFFTLKVLSDSVKNNHLAEQSIQSIKITFCSLFFTFFNHYILVYFFSFTSLACYNNQNYRTTHNNVLQLLKVFYLFQFLYSLLLPFNESDLFFSDCFVLWKKNSSYMVTADNTFQNSLTFPW